MRQSFLALRDLINHVLHGREVPGDIDWDQVYLLAQRHHLTGFVYRAAVGQYDISRDTISRIENSYFTAVGEQSRQEHYAELLFSALQERGIRYLPMTGYVMRRLYPQPSWRISSDLDVTIEGDRFFEVGEMLDALGFTRVEDSHEYDVYVLDHVIIRLYQENNEALWGTLTTEDGYEHHFTDEDYYLRILNFMRTRFLDGTCGIRAILDFHMYRMAKPEAVAAATNDILEREGLLHFAQSMMQLTDIWFGDAEMTDDMMLLGSYIAASGTLADVEALEIREHPWRRIFPRYRVMKRRYPFLRRAKILLPFMWVVRWFHLLFTHGHDHHTETLEQNTTLRSQKMRERVMEIVGLEKANQIGKSLS